MTTAIYVCPSCGERMERDLLLFVEHTDAHIMEQLKKSHPEWITSEGYCPTCLAHYKAARRGETLANIGGHEVTKRQVLAGVSLAVSLVFLAVLVKSGAPRSYRAFLFLPLFTMALGFFQAKKNHCVVLGMKGARNRGHGEEPVKDVVEKARLKKESMRLLFFSLASAAVLTAVSFLV